MLTLEDTSQMSTRLVILDRNRDGLDWDDPTVPGFGEIVKFDLPFVRATLTNETLGALPTSSPTASHSPSGKHIVVASFSTRFNLLGFFPLFF